MTTPRALMSNSVCVLVVDDDRDLRESVAAAAEEAGHAAAAAANGQEALEMLRGGVRISLVLLDLMMPDMNGEQVAAAIRSDRELAGVPIVLFSASSEARSIAGRIGVDGFLPKPFGLDKLSGLLDRYCRAPIATP